MLHYMLSGNFDTEKKTSSVNLLKTRGRRVTAEITVPREILMKASPRRTGADCLRPTNINTLRDPDQLI
jgi:hydroxymethylglutaryl-CoA reductase